MTEAERAWLDGLEGPLKVGADLDWPPFDFVQDGRASGFSQDLLRAAAAKVGLPLAYEIGKPWDEVVAGFEAGELDILPGLYQTPERMERMAFTPTYATNPSVLVARVGDAVDSMEAMRGRRMAVMPGYATTELMRQRYPSIEQVQVNSALNGLKAVAFGQADGFVGSFSVINYLLKQNVLPGIQVAGEVWLQSPEETDLHMAVMKGRPELFSILNKGLAAITPEEMDALRSRWLGNLVDHRAEPGIELSAEERAWLAAHPVIRIGVDPDYPPFDFVDDRGNHAGIAADTLQLVAEKLGVRFERVPGLSWQQVLEGAGSGAVDLVPVVTNTDERREYLNFTRDYIDFPSALMTRKDFPPIDGLADLNGRTLAIPEGYVYNEKIPVDYPDIRIVGVPKPIDALKAVAFGKADATKANLAVAGYLIQRENIPNLK
ncbi:MAG: transporter substrate-binding domain-containing protein, partial [Gammaproteobacteria bacterium]